MTAASKKTGTRRTRWSETASLLRRGQGASRIHNPVNPVVQGQGVRFKFKITGVSKKVLRQRMEDISATSLSFPAGSYLRRSGIFKNVDIKAATEEAREHQEH